MLYKGDGACSLWDGKWRAVNKLDKCQYQSVIDPVMTTGSLSLNEKETLETFMEGYELG